MGNNVSPACPLQCETNSKLVKAEMQWTINNFGFKSSCSDAGSIMESARFYSVENPLTKWTLQLYPGGITIKDAEDHISLFLALGSSSFGELYATQFQFTVWDAANVGKQLVILKGSKVFQERSPNWGFKKLIKRDQVVNIQSLVIHCQLTYELPESILTTIEEHPSVFIDPVATHQAEVRRLAKEELLENLDI